ncbi:hypothetical protein HY346_03340 [Candidatus Microgenomates bacterium]|nr:hypothetical protein [Candidatus Microgenomates bacterium]
MSGLMLQPPEIVEVEGPVVFLAGPIQGAPLWQPEAARLLHELVPSLTVANPRRDYPPGEFQYNQQVDWETHYLRRAGKFGVIMFWLAAQTEPTPSRAYAQTTRFELGEWKSQHEWTSTKLVIGIEKGFGNERYIRHRMGQDCPEVPILSTLAEACEVVASIQNK